MSHAHRQTPQTAVRNKNALALGLNDTTVQLTWDILYDLAHIGRVSEGGRHCDAALPQDRQQQVCFCNGQCLFVSATTNNMTIYRVAMQAGNTTIGRMCMRGKTTNVDADSLVLVIVCFVYIVNTDRTEEPPEEPK